MKHVYGFAALLSIFLFSASACGDEKPANIVIFLTDDLGWGDLGCYGHPRIQTPHLDRLAKEGMRFTQCYSASSVCSPSRSSVLTGRTPYRNGVYSWIPGGRELHLRSSEVSVAKLLKGRGYETCHVGKWHLNGKFNSPEQPQPNDHGYDHWLATQNNAAPSHKNPRNFVRNGEALGVVEGVSAVIVVDAAIEWLRKKRDPKAPFYLAVWTHEPHLPIESDPQFMKLYGDGGEGVRQHHGNVTQIDFAFGRLMKALDDLSLRDDTFVFFTSDNGPEGNGNKGRTRGSTGGLRGRKRALYEGGIRVPGIARWPGRIAPGSVSEQPVIGSDLFSTSCEIAGASIPTDRTIDGASLLPAFAEKPIDRELPLYWRYGGAREAFKIAMRDGDWKILATESLDRFELYHIEKDPRETKELSTEDPDRFAAMKKRLLELNAEIEKEGPATWKSYFARRKRAGAGRKKRLPSIGPGVDKTGDFNTVKGCTVAKGESGYVVESESQGFALRKLDKAFAKRVTLSAKYRSQSTSRTRNAFLTFGDGDSLGKLVHVGSAIGMGNHAMFRGGWGNLGSATKAKLRGEETQEFAIRVEIDLATRRVEATIGGVELRGRLPDDLRKIDRVGYFVKQTKTAFSPIEVSGD